MTGKWLAYHVACPMCDSSDAYSVDIDKLGWCHSCQNESIGGKQYKDEGDYRVVAKEPIVAKTLTSGRHMDIPDRCLTLKTCRVYDITCGKHGGVINAHVYPYYELESGEKRITKKRICPKESFPQEDARPVHLVKTGSGEHYERIGTVGLFGWQAFKRGGKSITVTEGELDAAAAYQMNGGYPVVSVQSSGSAHTNCQAFHEYLNSFDEVVLCFDADKVGHKAAKEVSSLFPGKCSIMQMKKHNDPCDYLKAGDGKVWQQEYWNKKPVKIVGVVGSVDDWRKAATVKPVKGTPLIWDGLNRITRGLRKNEVWTFGGGTKLGKCLAEGTEVLDYSGCKVKVENVKANDLLMGPDGKPRRVVSLSSGTDEMYRVTPTKGDPYVVNSEHILSVQCRQDRRYAGYKVGDIKDIPVQEFMKASKKFRTVFHGHRSKGWEGNPCSSYSLGHDKDRLDPYIIGLWLGDGTMRTPCLTNIDKILLDYWKDYAGRIGAGISDYSYGRPVTQLNMTGGKELLDKFRVFGLGVRKKIPDAVFAWSKEDRLLLLAGLIDADGSLEGGCYSMTQKERSVIDGYIHLCRSVGLACYEGKPRVVKGKEYYRAVTSGHINIIPVKLDRKKAGPRKRNKDVLVHNIKVEPCGKGKYFGFTLEEGTDKRFLLGDCTITHNTELLKELAFGLVEQHGISVGMILLEENATRTQQCLISKHVGWRYFLEGEEEASPAQLEAAATLFGGKIWLDKVRSSKWEDVEKTIANMVHGLGCQVVMVDHVTAIAEGKGGDVNSILHKAYEDLNTIVNRDNISIMAISHLNQSANVNHEEGARVTLRDFYGSGAIKQRSNFVFGWEGDLHGKEIPKDTRILRCLADRNAGDGGGRFIELKYTNKNAGDATSGRLVEIDRDYDEVGDA